MAKGAICWRNYADAGVLSTDSARADLGIDLLKHPQVSVKWRTAQAVSSAFVQVDLGSLLNVGVVALLATNLTSGATRRVRASTSSNLASPAHDSTMGAAGVDFDYGHLIYVLPADVPVRYVRIDVSDINQEYLEAGRLVVGPLWRFSKNFSWGYSRPFEDTSRITMTRSGHEWADIGTVRRGVSLPLNQITEAEWTAELEPMLLQMGTSRDILVLKDSASPNMGRDTVYGRIRSALDPTHETPNRWRQPITVMERF